MIMWSNNNDNMIKAFSQRKAKNQIGKEKNECILVIEYSGQRACIDGDQPASSKKLR